MHVGREVNLSGGAYNLPQRLMLSGIGQKAQLEAHGLTPKHVLAGVGEDLQDHYTSRMVARVKNIVTINQ